MLSQLASPEDFSVQVTSILTGPPAPPLQHTRPHSPSLMVNLTSSPKKKRFQSEPTRALEKEPYINIQIISFLSRLRQGESRGNPLLAPSVVLVHINSLPKENAKFDPSFLITTAS